MDAPDLASPKAPDSRHDNEQALRLFFTRNEIRRLNEARRSVRPESAVLAYCVYENPFAKSGGIFAVADNYCTTLQRAGRDVLILTPHHGSLKTAPNSRAVRQIGTCQVPFGSDSIEVDLLEHRRGDVRWILLRAEGFFDAEGGAGHTDPYVHSDPSKLLIDSLFACVVFPRAIAAMKLTENVIFHVQDWELASTALTVKKALLAGVLTSAAVVLTSHNPYDHALSSTALRLIARPATSQPLPADTVYQVMIPLADAPVTTVSKTFAREMTTDPLLTRHFAEHLQDVLRERGIVGVDNGLFGTPGEVYSQAALDAVAGGDSEPILREKMEKRRAMLRLLADYRDERIIGTLDAGEGRPLVELADDVPVFMMFGRLDPGQKGFDVLARAIEALPPGSARFILTPIVGGVGREFSDDLALLAAARPGEVAVYPFRMERGYMEAMGGATYAVMPSLYEPFGGATEPYLQGTPVVARGTGGLLQQVVGIDAEPKHGTGILYREQSAYPPEQWREVQCAESPAARLRVPLYGGMVTALAAALAHAGDLYRFDRARYGRMLSNLCRKSQSFSWDRTMKEYAAVYKTAVS